MRLRVSLDTEFQMIFTHAHSGTLNLKSKGVAMIQILTRCGALLTAICEAALALIERDSHNQGVK